MRIVHVLNFDKRSSLQVSDKTAAHRSEPEGFIKQVSVRAYVTTCNFDPTTSIDLKPFSCVCHERLTDFLSPGGIIYNERCDSSQIARLVKGRYKCAGNKAKQHALTLRNDHSHCRRAGIQFESILNNLSRKIVPSSAIRSRTVGASDSRANLVRTLFIASPRAAIHCLLGSAAGISGIRVL